MTPSERLAQMTPEFAHALANAALAERLAAWHFTGEVTAKGRSFGAFVGEPGPATKLWFELQAAATAGRKNPLEAK